MRNRLIAFYIILFSVAFSSHVLAHEKVAGIKSSDVDKHFQFQKTPVWCWAATIQMALNHYGFNVSQADIVQRTFGAEIHTTGNWLQMTNNLNYLGKSADNKDILVSATVYAGSPSAESIINHLKQNKPIIMAFQNPGTFSGHAVLITAVKYKFINNKAVISSFIVRDPFPYNQQHVNNRGKIEVANGTIQPTNIWLVDATIEN